MSEPLPIIGVSLGHRHERTGLAVVERPYVPVSAPYNFSRHTRTGETFWEARQDVKTEYHVRHLERQGPPSRYAKVATRVADIAEEIARDFLMVVDVTATGRPAYSLILGELFSRKLGDRGQRFVHGPVTVTAIAGGVSKSPDAGHLIPRRDLISATQILFDQGQLKIAASLSLAGVLKDELLGFSSKPPKPDTLEGWREGKNDDLVLAVATSAWAAERFLKKREWLPANALEAVGS